VGVAVLFAALSHYPSSSQVSAKWMDAIWDNRVSGPEISYFGFSLLVGYSIDKLDRAPFRPKV
jgi:hypothetical protein